MANFYSQMSHALRARGHWVEVFSQGFHGEYSEVVDAITVHRVQARLMGKNLAGMNGKRIPFHWFVRALGKRLCTSFLKRHKEVPFNVVEAHDHLGISATLPELNVPIFLTGHTTLAVFESVPGFSMGVGGSILEVCKQEYAAHLQADTIRFLSHDLLKRTCDLFPGISQKCSVVFNPCLIPDAIDYTAYEQNPYSFLFLGRLESRKGCQLIPAALKTVWRRFPDVTVTFVGQDTFYRPAHLSMSDYLREQCGEKVNQLEFLGWRPKREVDELTQRYPYVLVPSLYDNSAFAAQEGMAHGRCVICSNAGGTKEYVADCGLVFEAGSPESLAGAMIECLSNPMTSLKLAENAARRARTLFSREQFADDFLNEVEAVAASRTHPLS